MISSDESWLLQVPDLDKKTLRYFVKEYLDCGGHPRFRLEHPPSYSDYCYLCSLRKWVTTGNFARLTTYHFSLGWFKRSLAHKIDRETIKVIHHLTDQAQCDRLKRLEISTAMTNEFIRNNEL